jgi:hypothetical protein
MLMLQMDEEEPLGTEDESEDTEEGEDQDDW